MASGVKLTIDILKNRLSNINPNIEIISEVYKNTRTLLNVRCKVCNYEWQKRFDDLYGNYNRKLSYDFYLPLYNVLIEYQGKQHYSPVDLFGGESALKIRIEYDKIKREYARSKCIDLLEINYNDNIEEKLNIYFKTKSRND